MIGTDELRLRSAAAEADCRLDIRATTTALCLAVVTVQVTSFAGAFLRLRAGVPREAQPLAFEHLSKVTKFLLKFDVGGEQTVGAWLSTVLLLLCALVLLHIGTMQRHRDGAHVRHWLGLGVIFCGLSMDEAVSFHEMTIRPLHGLLGTSGLFLYAWVIPGLAFVAAVGITYLGFLRHLEPAFRIRFLLAGALFVGGAVGFEMVEGVLAGFYAQHPLIREVAFHVEDALESAGELLFLDSLLRYALRHEQGLIIRLK
jgi:hypothetical protein